MTTQKLRGIIPPLITPLTDERSLDHAGLERLVEHVLAGGVHGLFLLGTTGEGPALPYPLRRELVCRVCAQVAGRVPVLVSITDTVLAESVLLAHHAADCGADAVVVAPPYYFPLSPPELRDYAREVAAAVPLPFYLYNLPSLTKVWIDAETVQACGDLPGFRGLKDSSGDLIYFKRMQRLLGATQTHALFIGPEELLIDGLLAGGDGGVAGGANVWPSLYVDIFERAQRQDWVGARLAQERVLDISRRVYAIGGYGATVTKALKAALEIEGICGRAMTRPMAAWGKEECAVLARELQASAPVGRV